MIELAIVDLYLNCLPVSTYECAKCLLIKVIIIFDDAKVSSSTFYDIIDPESPISHDVQSDIMTPFPVTCLVNNS